MKRIFLAVSLIIAAASVTNVLQANSSVTAVNLKSGGDDGSGKHIAPSQLPQAVMASFNTNFPTATNAQWEKEREHGGTTYKADFQLNGKRWRAVFAPDGTILSSGRH